MKKKLGVILSFIIMAVCSAFFLPIKNENKTAFGAEAQENYESNYLYDGENVYLSTVVGGSASGYGQYAKGTESATLTATAEDGFELVGWRVVVMYTEDEADFKTLFVNNSNTIDNVITFGVTYSDTNSDGKNDSGELLIESCQVDMRVSPVFSYIYYNVVIEDVDKIQLDNETEIGTGVYLYYSSQPEGVDNVYNDAIIKIGDQYNYFGTLYSDNGKYYKIHSKNMSRNEGEEDGVLNIEYNRGAFKLSDQVELNLEIKDDTYIDVIGLNNYNKTNVNPLTVTNNETLSDNQYKITKHATNKNTETISALFDIEKKYILGTNTYLKANYDQLYKISYDFKIDGSAIDENYLVTSNQITAEELKNLLLKNISITNTFSTFNGLPDVYLVKSNMARVKCEENITDETNKYLYYKFAGITGYGDNPLFLNNLDSNKTLTINYTSENYKVEFKYVLEDGTDLSKVTSFVMPTIFEDFILKRGKSVTLTLLDSTKINSTGFNYLTTKIEGTTNEQDLNEGDFTVSMDLEQPKNLVVLMVYSYVEYKVNLAQFTEDFNLNGVYPLLSATLKIERGDKELSSTLGYVEVLESKVEDFGKYYEYKNNVLTKSDKISGNTHDPNKTYYINNVYGNDFDISIHIGDRINLIAQVTNSQAFDYTGWYYSKSGNIKKEYVSFDRYTINNYSYLDGDDYKLKLLAEEVYKTYSLIYNINYKEVDDVNYIMAKIGTDTSSLDLTYSYYHQVLVNTEADYENYYEIDNNQLKKSTSVSPTYIANKTYYTLSDASSVYNLIVIDGFRYNDTITLNATSNLRNYDKNNNGQVEVDEGDYFVFINFVKNDSIFKASSSSGTPIVSKREFGVTENGMITVNYSEPKASLIIDFSNNNAKTDGLYTVEYDNSGYEAFGTDKGQEYYYDADEKIYYASSTAKIRVTVLEDKIKFGYKFTGITIDKGVGKPNTLSLPSLTDKKYIFDINFAGQYQYQVTLNFALKEYRVDVLQNGAGFDGSENSKYDFDSSITGIQPLSMNVENLKVNITIPTYYYVSEVLVPTKEVNNGYTNADILLLELGISSRLSQTNTDVEYDFSIDFSDKLEAFAAVAEVGELETGTGYEYTKIVLKLTYEIHTTNIDIMYGIDNGNNNLFDLFPTLTPNESIGQEFITERAQRIGVRFKNVPFNTTLKINVDKLIEGLEYKDGTTNSNEITFANIGSDLTKIDSSTGENIILDTESLDLVLTKYSIDLNINYIGKRGRDIYNGMIYTTDNNEKIANPEYSTATLFGNLSLDTRANKANGIKFDSMYYFSRFTGDEETFKSIYNTLYVYNSGEKKFEKNVSDQFDLDTTYYIKKDVTNSSISEQFTPVKFGAIDKKVKIYVTYKDQLFDLDYNAKEESGTESLSFAGLQPKDYATYSIKANGNVTEKLKFKDDVLLLIVLKDELINGISLKHVKLNTIDPTDEPTWFKNYTQVVVSEFETGVEYFTLVGNDMLMATETQPIDGKVYYIVKEGSYIVKFQVDSSVAGLVIDDKLRITLEYVVEKKEISAQTNVLDSSFFYGTDSMGLKITEQNGDEWDTDYNYSVSKSDVAFLSQSKVQFEFKGEFEKYFEIKDDGFKIYYQTSDGNRYEVEKDEYEQYGISKIYVPANGVDVFKGVTVHHIVKGKIIVEFIVVPIITLHEDKDDTNPSIYNFTKEYKEINWVGQENKLSVGENATFDIETVKVVEDQMIIEYYNEGSQTAMTDLPKNAGKYNVKIKFKTDGWWRFINFDYQINMTINRKTISMYYNTTIVKLEKTYDGKSGINQEGNSNNKNLLYNNLCVVKDYKSYNLSSTNLTITDSLTYEMGILNADHNFETAIKVSSDPYRIQISGFALTESNEFNRNYQLASDSFVTEPIMYVLPKDVYISGIKIYDKVYDETQDATYYLENGQYNLDGLLSEDNDSEKFMIDFDTVKYSFAENGEVGPNKKVIVDLAGAVRGEMSGCYNVIAPNNLTASIYPYSVSAELKDFGKITLINKRGKADCTNQDLVRLIPIDPTTKDKKPKLVINEIAYESEKYFEIYKQITSLLKGKKYKTGFSLVFSVNNSNVAIDNNLYLSLPEIQNNQTALYVTNNSCGELVFEDIDGEQLIDLSKNQEKLKAVSILTKRTYMKSWQITLIIVGVAVVVGAGLTTFLVLRNKKKKHYRDKDTI